MQRLHKKWGLILLVVFLVGLSGCVHYDDNGNSTEAPAAPGKPTLTAANAKITVNWDPVSGATSYEVWWNTKEETETASMIHDSNDADVTCEIAGTNGLTYYVWVKAKNTAGTSDFSPVAYKTLPTTP